MNGATRQLAIRSLMRPEQRRALEAYMRELWPGPEARASGADSAGAARPRQRAARGGIYKSAEGAKVYGYYAKAGLKRLTFCTRIQRRLQDAVRDHAVLSRLLERVQREGAEAPAGLPARVRSAVAAVLGGEGLEEREFLRSVTVTFSVHFWLGRCLYVHRRDLDTALEALAALEAAKVPTPPGDRGALERARQEWRRVRQAFVQLQTQDASGARRAQVEERLAALEASHGPMRARKEALLRMRQQRHARRHPPDACGDAPLVRRLERKLRAWAHETARQRRRAALAEARERTRRLELGRKRRWDGKESYADFMRRRRRDG